MRTIKSASLAALLLVLTFAGSASAAGAGQDKDGDIASSLLEAMANAWSILQEPASVGESTCQTRIDHAFQRCQSVCGARGIIHFDPGSCGVGSVCICGMGGGGGPPGQIP